MNRNYFTSYLFGQNQDVALSYEQYNEITEVLIDQYLSRTMMMNFKNCSQMNHDACISAPIQFIPLSAFLTSQLFLNTARKGANKVFMPFFTSITVFLCWRAFTVPVPKRLYTKILADPTVDGQYVRTQVATMKPGLWKILSRELYNKGYRFPEMNEYKTTTEFPHDFVEPY